MPPRAKAKATPDSPGEDSDGRPVPSPAEAHMFFTLIKNMKSKPDIDWEAVALDNNFKNADTAKVRFGQIKRKLGLQDIFSGATGGGAAAKPAARARGKKAVASPTTANVEVKTPGVVGGVKKKTSPGKRGVRPKIEDLISDASDPVTPTKSAKGGKKSTLKAEVKAEDEDITLLIPHDTGSQDGEEEDMDMDDEEPLGQITPSKTRSIPSNPTNPSDDSNCNHDSDVEVTGSSVVKGRGRASVQTLPAYTSNVFRPSPVQVSTIGHGYEGFIPAKNTGDRNQTASFQAGRSLGGNGYVEDLANSGGNGYAEFISRDTHHTSALELNAYVPMTFGGIKERNDEEEEDDSPLTTPQRDALRPALPIRGNDAGRDDFDFALMMTSNMPGGDLSSSYGAHQFDSEDMGYDLPDGPSDIFQPTPTRPFGTTVEVLNNADSYFAPTRKQARARKPPGGGNGSADAGAHVI